MRKYTKNAIAMVLILLIVFNFSGCSVVSDAYVLINQDNIAKLEVEKVLKYLDEKDNEGLKNMFCVRTLSMHDIDEQIQNAMDFFEGKIVSYNSLVGIGSDGDSVDNGKVEEIHTGPLIENIKTDTDKVYKIRFYSYLVYEKDKDYVGIRQLIITDEKGDERTIGEYFR